MSRRPLQSDPLALAKFQKLVAMNDLRGAVQLVRDGGYSVLASVVSWPRGDVLQALERRSPDGATLYRQQHAAELAREAEARTCLDAIATGTGDGLLRDEVVAVLLKPPAGMSLTPAQRVDGLRELGAHAEAELVRAQHPFEVARARLEASKSAAAAEQAKIARDKAISDRVNPRLSEVRREIGQSYNRQIATLNSEFRDGDGSVATGAPAYQAGARAISEECERRFAAARDDFTRAAETEIPAT